MEWYIRKVTVTGESSLAVEFADGTKGTILFEPGFFRGAFAELSAPEKFAGVFLDHGAVTWPGGLELAPDAMYDDIRANNGVVCMTAAA